VRTVTRRRDGAPHRGRTEDGAWTTPYALTGTDARAAALLTVRTSRQRRTLTSGPGTC